MPLYMKRCESCDKEIADDESYFCSSCSTKISTLDSISPFYAHIAGVNILETYMDLFYIQPPVHLKAIRDSIRELGSTISTEDEFNEALRKWDNYLRYCGIPEIAFDAKPLITTGDIEIINTIIAEIKKHEHKFKSEYSHIYSRLGVVFMKIEKMKRRYLKAREYFIKANNVNPQGIIEEYNLAYIEYLIGNIESATRRIEKLLTRNEKIAGLWYLRGMISERSGRWGLAIQYLEQATVIDENLRIADIEKCRIYIDNKKYTEINKIVDRLLGANPKDTDAWYYKGLALLKTNRWGGAIQCFEKAMESNPQHIETLRVLVDVYKEHDRKDLSEKYQNLLDALK